MGDAIETKNLDIWVTDSPESIRRFISDRNARTTIPGLDVTVATSRVVDSAARRANDIVIARQNNHETSVRNGDMGLVVSHNGRLMVETGEQRLV
jgi:hypothetical protein